MSYTTTYSILEVKQSTFDDVKDRLNRAGVGQKHVIRNHKYGEAIVLGSVGLVVEKVDPLTKRKDMKSCCKHHATGAPASYACSELTYMKVRI